jgi:hypothetical protein
MGREHARVVRAEVPQPGVQEADGEPLVPAQRADDLVHRAVVTRGTGRGDHQVDRIAADLVLQLGLLTLGDQGAAIAGDAGFLLGQAIRERAGAGLRGTSKSTATTATTRPSSLFIPWTSHRIKF